MDLSLINKVFSGMGFSHLTFGNVIMWGIALILIILAIRKNYEPLLLVPIGFGILLANIPLTDLMKQ